MKNTLGNLIVLCLLCFTSLLFSQNNFAKNFIQIKCNGRSNEPGIIYLYQDSLLVWSFGIPQDSDTYSTQFFYDKNRQLIKFINYTNSILSEVHDAEFDKNGNLIPFVMQGASPEDCNSNRVNVECKKDAYGRVIELKTYRFGKNKSKKNFILDTWVKYYYVPNVDFLNLSKYLSGFKEK